MNQYLFLLPESQQVATAAENVRIAIESLHATGVRNWIWVRGNNEEDFLTRTDYACILYDEWKWEQPMRALMVKSMEASIQQKPKQDVDPNKPVYAPQMPSAAKAKIEKKKQLGLFV